MVSEGRRWVDLALSVTPPEPTTQRIRTIAVAAWITNLQGDVSTAKKHIAEARQHLQVVADTDARGMIDMVDGYIAMFSGELERARDCLKRAASVDDVEIQVPSMVLLGWTLGLSGDVEQALSWSEKALAVAEPRGESIMRAQALSAVASCRWLRGEAQAAETLLHESLQLFQPLKDRSGSAMCLEMLAWVASSNDDQRRVVVLMAAADALTYSSGTAIMAPAARLVHEACERRAREQLDAAEFDAAWNQGNSLAFDDVLAIALT
jgi:tetratricopeptide (TPR) repeat protein